ncbi:hypothetical protein K458DRAFT_413145 [Lentithecium fluviatile CBS 122367]|uniref:Uncharacterized protein n=1 Tax=Lentithecium fluviatile CBS 122367 TaxID=1168545 RepID=A0A6G1JIK1_9PLEO|nr:hypothetical protein K458DRAFT_413145 [Lentithecium fluviatile CBS 122367]
MALQTVDVTKYADDDNKLKEIFKDKTGRDGTVYDWQTGRNPQVRGPYKETFALIIKHNSGDGTVKIFKEDTNLKTYQTYSESNDGVTMIFLGPTYYCWWLADAKVKCII